MVVICAGCERPILERFLLNVLDRAWHAKCVQCTDCKGPLTDKCFSRGGKLYCREDFFRRFGTKCGGCSQGISPNDLVRRARNKVFHLKCFTCMLCRKQLSTGEELYVLDENKFICKEDYLNSKYAGSDGEDNDLDFDQAMLDKVDDTLSDKASSLQDDDSRDSSLPLGGVQHHNGHMTSQHVPLAHAPSLPSTLSPGGAAAAAAAAAAASGAGVLMPEIKQEKNNNMETSGGDALIATSGQNGGPHDLNSNHSDTDSSHSNSDNSNNSNNNNKENNNNKDSCGKEEKVDEKQSGGGTKRRGPRTTIKAKQLETLKAAFAATPKPTRHIREQLAQETGLNMRVIQVWFQNRRSKERRMKQLSALGARRQFFRNPRRLRALRPGEELDGDMMQAGFNYFGENGDFYPGFPGYGDYYPGQPGEHVPGMTFLPPSQGNPPMVEPLPGQMPPGGEGQFGALGDLSLPPSGSPEPHIPIHPDGTVFGNGGHPPRSMAGQYNQGIQHGPSQEMTSEAW